MHLAYIRKVSMKFKKNTNAVAALRYQSHYTVGRVSFANSCIRLHRVVLHVYANSVPFPFSAVESRGKIRLVTRNKCVQCCLPIHVTSIRSSWFLLWIVYSGLPLTASSCVYFALDLCFDSHCSRTNITQGNPEICSSFGSKRLITELFHIHKHT